MAVEVTADRWLARRPAVAYPPLRTARLAPSERATAEALRHDISALTQSLRDLERRQQAPRWTPSRCPACQTVNREHELGEEMP